MKPIMHLARVVHGSHLYGTSTPQSDLDFKGVHIPSGEAILLQRAENVLDTSTVLKDSAGKNLPGSVDMQSYSLQKFFKMLMDGDTVATEILFAPVNCETEPWTTVRAVGKQLLNRQCKGFVGYCQRQAAKYGIKGSRMGDIKRLIDLIGKFQARSSEKLVVMQDYLERFAGANEHAEWVNIPSPNGTDLWHIKCCDRAMPMTATIAEALKVYTRVWDNYGERARAAMTNEGIDWKAVSHAMRVAGQAAELLTTGEITFPRPDANYLLEIKLGKLPYKEISSELEWAVQNVQKLAEISKLPETSDKKLADELVSVLYKGQICD